MQGLNCPATKHPEIEAWPVDGMETLGRCPVCASQNRVLLYRELTDRVYSCAPGKWQLHRCNGCGSAYIDPRPSPETIGLAYQSYYTHRPGAPAKSPGARESWPTFRHALRNGYLNAKYATTLSPAHQFGRFLIPLIVPLRVRAERYVRHLPPPRPGARLLEIGCGNGSFLVAMRDLGWAVHGLEPDAKAAMVARGQGLTVTQGVLDSTLFQESQFDAITMHHVIEHLHDPSEVLQICLRILRPSGVLSIITPNFASRGSKLFKANWYPLQPPAHLVLFTTKSLLKTVQGVGFEHVRAHASFFGAESILRDSAMLQDGPAVSLGGERGRYMQFAARLTNLFFSLVPWTSEEAVVTGRKAGPL